MSVTIFNQLVPADTFTFDNIENFTVRSALRITQHPVELGSDVTDNAQKLNQVIAFRGIVTTTPLTVPRPESFNLAQSFFERNEQRLVTVVGPLGIFSNCLIQSWPRTATSVQKLPFDVVMQQIRLASAVSVPIPVRLPAPPLQTGAASAADAGAQATAPVGNASTLAAIADGAAALFGG